MGSYECLCKKVGFEVSGEPTMAVYCHCERCRVFLGTAARVAAYQVEQFRVTKGEDQLLHYFADPETRHTCASCGSFVFQSLELPFGGGLSVAPLGGIKFHGEPVLPTMHIYYADRAFDVHDDLPKFDGGPPEAAQPPCVTSQEAPPSPGDHPEVKGVCVVM